ncbi:hypothetical protein [Streptomyces goshikiensis]|uniref:hypothetical protein n=1 Tax=Streptomyces goshikiensis TaxID=1942 RepID=UPI0036CD8C2F
MTGSGTGSDAGVQADVPVRRADLGRDGPASTIGTARWLEDARIRLRLHRFERLIGEGRFGPFRILIVGQRVSRLAPAGPADDSGPLRLPDELIADLGVADAVGPRGEPSAGPVTFRSAPQGGPNASATPDA